MKVEVNKPCCVCSSIESELVFEIDYSTLHYPGKFSIRKCVKCNFLFNSPRLTDEELYGLYDNNYYFFQRNDSDEFKRIANIYQRTVALIPNGLSEKKVAEIGSGKGYLLAFMKHLGWSVQGIELSTEATQFAISKFNVPTFAGTIDHYLNNNSKDTFPLVLAIDVIEHVPNPINFLNHVDKLLMDNGLLIMDTPNGNAKNIDYLGKKWQAFNPFHVYFFSIPIFQKLLSNMGYLIEKSFSYNNRLEKINLKQNLRDFLLKLGVLEQVENVYIKLKNIAKKNNNDVESMISTVNKILKKSPSYFDTEDSKNELSKDNRGNNIVIIARKNP